MPPVRPPHLATIWDNLKLWTSLTPSYRGLGLCNYTQRLEAHSPYRANVHSIALRNPAQAGKHIKHRLSGSSRPHRNLQSYSNSLLTNPPRRSFGSITKFSKMASQQTDSESSSPASSIESTTPLVPASSASDSSAAFDFDAVLVKHNITRKRLNEVHSLLIDIATDAGKIMVAAEDCIITTVHKNNTSDVVTKFDKQIEAMAERRLAESYPECTFLGEETFKHGTKLADTPTFIVDPIDGTLNFSLGVPNCAISLALTIDKKPVVDVVFNPFRGDMYHAIKGQGAYLTKTFTNRMIKLPVQPVPKPMPSLNSCLMAVEWGNQRSGPNWALRTSIHNALLTSKVEGGAMCKSVRSNGSAALDFSYVAHGMLDAFWEGGVYSWDVAAGWCILEEAGGVVVSANPGNWDPELEGRLYFAVRNAKREDQRAVIQELWGMMGDRKFVFP